VGRLRSLPRPPLPPRPRDVQHRIAEQLLQASTCDETTGLCLVQRGPTTLKPRFRAWLDRPRRARLCISVVTLSLPSPLYARNSARSCGLIFLRREAPRRADWPFQIIGRADSNPRIYWRARGMRPRYTSAYHFVNLPPVLQAGGWLAACDSLPEVRRSRGAGRSDERVGWGWNWRRSRNRLRAASRRRAWSVYGP